MSDEGEVWVGEEEGTQGLLPLLQAASIQGRVAQGPDAGAPLGRMGKLGGGGAPFVPGSLCAEVDGFSLHAGVWVGAHERERLEHLCRYIARPPFAAGRLKWSRYGRVLYELRKPWRDGTTHVVFEPEVLLERLAALVPPPRMHQQTYHGVLAPSASWRDEVVGAREETGSGVGAPRPKKRTTSPRPPHRYLWAELMRRVFGLDVLRCEVCGAHRRLVSGSPSQGPTGPLRSAGFARAPGLTSWSGRSSCESWRTSDSRRIRRRSNRPVLRRSSSSGSERHRRRGKRTRCRAPRLGVCRGVDPGDGREQTKGRIGGGEG